MSGLVVFAQHAPSSEVTRCGFVALLLHVVYLLNHSRFLELAVSHWHVEKASETSSVNESHDVLYDCCPCWVVSRQVAK